MPRYIDLDEAIEHLSGECMAKYPLSFANEISVAISEINRFPNADVVPKSEYDRLKKSFRELIQEAKGYLNRIYGIRADVAREIFEEIEFEIQQLDFDREETRAIAIEGIISLLKKKYTEGNNGRP